MAEVSVAPRFLVGIDLGTTNSALGYVDVQRKSSAAPPPLQTFSIPQLIGPGDLAGRALLPSFLYLPGPHDLPAGATAVPWDPERSYVVGEFARNYGARVPGRLVSSAKSWLCHAGVDRTAKLLPWTAPPDVERISPVEASGRYLRHMVDGWNYAMAGGRAEWTLENQVVVLTVPASFDDVARNLTVEAARQAGLKNLTLLEEPQAAFYCWLAQHSAQEAAALKPGMRCLVVDVGGGTSDFSLIRAVEERGGLGFVRDAVGDHLLLGGDNMDLALAKYVETKLPAGGKLDAVQYAALTQACRLAKEALLAPNPPASFTVTVMGRGRQVIGGSVHTSLTQDEVHQVVHEGFFPRVPRDAQPQRGPRTGLHEMGLPYVSDPAITRHLALFLQRHADGPRETVPASGPEAILFNGGVFQPESVRERLLDVLRPWYERDQIPWQPLVLTNPSLDLAVAHGAAYYAWLKHTGGRRIGGGMARSYYVAVETQAAAPAQPMPAGTITVLCVVPQHLEEGQEISIPKPELELALGQPVLFPLYTSTIRGGDPAGAVLQVAPDQLLQLPPLHTILRGGKRSGTKRVPVTLAARCTEIGTLELWCVAKEGGNRWRLEFNVRDIVSESSEEAAAAESSPRQLADVWPETQVQEALDLIKATYQATPEPSSPPQELTKRLEAVLEASRERWPLTLCRRLADTLLAVAEERRRSPAHLSRWYHLTGYCLRPGYGDPLDKYRVDQLWKLFNAPPRGDTAGRAVPRAPEGGADYWIMWRRLAGGLNGPLQHLLWERLRPILLPGKSKPLLKPGPNELAEMWRAASSLERLEPKQKEVLGQALLKTVRRSPVPTYSFWALTRLGARVLLYGPLNTVLHPQIAERWLDALLGFQPGNDSERLAWSFCLSQLARKSGQRALDIDDAHRERVLTILKSQAIPAHWVRMVGEVTELERDEESQLFGESLPIGLRLIQSAN